MPDFSLKCTKLNFETGDCYPRRLAYVSRREYRTFEFVCLSVTLSICLFVCPQHNSKTNDPEVFKLGEGNDRGI